MNLVAAKCPNCGANIEVSPNAETTRCKSCGSAILVEDAIQKYKIEVSGQVSMSGISSVENDIERGNQCLAARDWQAAFKIFSAAVNKQANNYSAWIGCLEAASQNYSAIDFSWVTLGGAIGLETIINNCIKYATPEQRTNTMTKVKSIRQIIHAKIEAEAQKRRKHVQKVRRGWAIFCLFDFISLLEFVPSIFSGDTEIIVSIGFVLYEFFLVVIGLRLWKPVKPDKYRNRDWMNYLTKIDNSLAGTET